jgi:hypothetical protein
VDFTPSEPSLEETEEFGRKVTGLSGRARWQVRKLLAVLTRMRKSLPPSARIEAVRRLGWRLGPGIEACRTIAEGSGTGPTRAPEGGDQIGKFLEEWQQKYKESEERYRVERDEAFRSDDEAAHAEEQLAAEKAAELEKRTKMIEQRLPIIAARLGILWNEVTGSSRPVPSEIWLTSTGTEMTTEEHVATAETHLRYAEGHLQPSEEHLADAEVHLKLVKAHLAALVAMEILETKPFGAAVLPPLEPTSDEASTDQDGAAREGKTGVRLRDPKWGPRSGGADPTARRSARERGSVGCAPSTCARIRRLTPWMSVGDSRACLFPRGRRRSRSGIAASAASWILGTGRLAAGATVGPDSVGIACWGWCRRQRRTRLRAEGVSSNNLEERPLRAARTPPQGGSARITAGAAGARGSCRGDRQTCGVSPRSAKTRS